MSIRCACGVPVKASNVNLAAAIATCDACGAVFTIGGPAAHPARSGKVQPPSWERVETPSTEVTSGYRSAPSSTPRAKQWRYRWFFWTDVLMVLFCLFWDSIVSVFVALAIAAGGWMGLLSLFLPHVWIGIALTWRTLAGLLNHTTVGLTEERLTVTHGPIPWRGRDVPRAQIRSLYVEKSALGQRNSAHRYEVRYVDSNGIAQKLVSGLTEDEAEYLTGELSRAIEAPVEAPDLTPRVHPVRLDPPDDPGATGSLGRAMLPLVGLPPSMDDGDRDESRAGTRR